MSKIVFYFLENSIELIHINQEKIYTLTFQIDCAVLRLAAQSCLIHCDPMDLAHQAPLSMGILQARILEWVAMPSSRGSSQPRNRTGSNALQADSIPSKPPGKIALIMST